MKIINVITIIFLLVSHSIAQADNSSKIIGKWEAVGRSWSSSMEKGNIEDIPKEYRYIWEFTKEGKIISTNKFGKDVREYTVVGNELRINKSGIIDKQEIIELKSNALTLKKGGALLVYFRKL